MERGVCILHVDENVPALPAAALRQKAQLVVYRLQQCVQFFVSMITCL